MNRGLVASNDREVVFASTSTIDGLSSLNLPLGQGLRVFSDGTNYYTNRKRTPVSYTFEVWYATGSIQDQSVGGNPWRNYPTGWNFVRIDASSFRVFHNLGRYAYMLIGSAFNATIVGGNPGYITRAVTGNGTATYSMIQQSTNDFNVYAATPVNSGVGATGNTNIIYTVMFL